MLFHMVSIFCGPGAAGGPDALICSRHHPGAEQAWHSPASHRVQQVLHLGQLSPPPSGPHKAHSRGPFSWAARELTEKVGGSGWGAPGSSGPAPDSGVLSRPGRAGGRRAAGGEPRNYRNYSPACAAGARPRRAENARPRPAERGNRGNRRAPRPGRRWRPREPVREPDG